MILIVVAVLGMGLVSVNGDGCILGCLDEVELLRSVSGSILCTVHAKFLCA